MAKLIGRGIDMERPVTKSTFVLTFAVGLAVGHFGVPVLRAHRHAVKTSKLLTKDLGAWCEGKELTVELDEAAPGPSGKHYHPAHSVTWVIEGSEVYQKEGQQPRTVNAGDVLYEEPLELHAVDNLSAVKLLVVRIAKKGKPTTVRVR
ncbi:MAG TPA: cupin domain-containing protein [Vicinamibacterales bacterium]|nr:cupin domain-containing protein [Vicinamibacterales bacterium]